MKARTEAFEEMGTGYFELCADSRASKGIKLSTGKRKHEFHIFVIGFYIVQQYN